MIINQNFYNHYQYFNNNYYFGNNRLPAYYYHLHRHWQPSGWLRFYYYPSFFNYYSIDRYANTIHWGQPRLVYVNPFFISTSSSTASWLDYSRPIPVPAPDAAESRLELIRSEQAVRRFDDAREQFQRGDYRRAQELIDQAIRLLPGDPTLHQFRALVLFARGRYSDAAATIHGVLAVSQGWDWDTISRFYPDPQLYDRQLQALSQYILANPAEIDGRFLMAYHCLALDDPASSYELLQQVLAALPNDQVTRDLLHALEVE